MILLYHANCPDGFGAAFSFWKKYGNTIEYIPVQNNAPLLYERFINQDVIMVDIAFDEIVLQKIKDVASSFYVLDHHLSNMLKLQHLDYCKFDMNKSGAMLAWSYCFNTEPLNIIKYIQTRDLWIWDLPNAKEVTSYIDSFDFNFETWDKIANELEENLVEVSTKGKVIIDYLESIKRKILKNTFMMEVQGFRVPVLNTPFFKSETLNLLSEDYPFAVAYHFDGSDYIFSLRSNKNNKNAEDVSIIAGKYGGGGHKNASGFTIKSFESLGKIK